MRVLARTVALLSAPALLVAQEPAMSVDSLHDAGAAAGRVAANRPDVTIRGLVGAIGGTLFGFSTIAAFGAPAMMVPSAGGLITATVAGSAGSAATPASLERELGGRPASYATAFREAYQQQLERRRTRAAWIGGVIGTVGGVVLFWKAFNDAPSGWVSRP